jgi:DNA mismatch repair protein MSH5
LLCALSFAGVAVLSAAIHKLSQIGCKVICTTHFLEIFSLHLLHDSKDGVSALRMAVHISEGDNFPLFRLEKGIATASAGLACARTAGVQGGILTRVKEILDATKEGRPVPPIPDNLNSNSALQTRAKLAIHAFISVDDWIESSKENLLLLEQKVSSM